MLPQWRSCIKAVPCRSLRTPRNFEHTKAGCDYITLPSRHSIKVAPGVQNTQGLLVLGFKQTWEKVRCSCKAAERLPSLVSWLWVVASFGFNDISLWHSKIFSWRSLAERYHSSSGDGSTVEGASLGEPVYIFLLKNTIYSCLCPPTHLQEGAGLWSSCEEVLRPLLPANQGTVGAELSPSASSWVLKSCLATRSSASGRPSPGRLPRETSFQSEIFYLNISYSVQIAGKEGSRQNESKETVEEEWEIKEGCQGSEWARIQGKIRE